MPKVCPVCSATYPDTNIFCPTDGSTLRAADSEGDLIGSVVADRYLVTDLLGEGGMGRVYLARHVRLPLQAAIKVLHRELLTDSASVTRFNREAANASSIEHERVARVFDFGETPEGLIYLAMEYVNGPTLRKILDRDGPLSIERTAVIVRQVADGLDAAHRLGIVHRDLKPDNIMVQTDDEGIDRCKVVDFGIAKAVGSQQRETGLTRTGFVVGTPEFMSPEQLFGESVDHRSDVYALALVAYECLTLDLPFDRNTPDHGMTARLVSEPRTLSLVRPDLQWSPELQAAFNEALDRDPATRTASAGAFARAFEVAARPSASVHASQIPLVSATHASNEGRAPAAASSHLSGSDHTSATATSVQQSDSAQSGAALAVSETSSRQEQATRQASSVTNVGHADGTSPRSRLPLVLSLMFSVMLLFGALWRWNARQEVAATSGAESSANSPAEPTGPVTDERQPAGASPVDGQATDAVEDPDITDSITLSPPPEPPTQAPASGGNQPRRPSTPGVRAGVNSSPRAALPTSGNTIGASRAVATLDSITKVLDPSTANEATARAAVPILQTLVARLPTGTDSTWAYIRIAEAHLLMDEVRPACTALRLARGTARSMAQAEVINRYTGQLGCVP